MDEQREAEITDLLNELSNALFMFTIPAHAAALSSKNTSVMVDEVIESLEKTINIGREGVDAIKKSKLAQDAIPLARNPKTERVAVAAAMIAHAKILLRDIATIKDVGQIDDAMMELLGRMMDDREKSGQEQTHFMPVFKLTVNPDKSINVGAAAINDDELDEITKRTRDKYGIDNDKDV